MSHLGMPLGRLLGTRSDNANVLYTLMQLVMPTLWNQKHQQQLKCNNYSSTAYCPKAKFFRCCQILWLLNSLHLVISNLPDHQQVIIVSARCFCCSSDAHQFKLATSPSIFSKSLPDKAFFARPATSFAATCGVWSGLARVGGTTSFGLQFCPCRHARCANLCQTKSWPFEQMSTNDSFYSQIISFKFAKFFL